MPNWPTDSYHVEEDASSFIRRALLPLTLFLPWSLEPIREIDLTLNPQCTLSETNIYNRKIKNLCIFSRNS